jgi:hypothetical protein
VSLRAVRGGHRLDSMNEVGLAHMTFQPFNRDHACRACDLAAVMKAQTAGGCTIGIIWSFRGIGDKSSGAHGMRRERDKVVPSSVSQRVPRA